MFRGKATFFFCNCKDLTVLEDFGKRFKAITTDDEQFARCVAEGIPQENARREAEKELKNSLRGFFMEHPNVECDIQTPEGCFSLPPEFVKFLSEGKVTAVVSKDWEVEIEADDFLNYKIDKAQQDLFDENRFQIKAVPPLEQTMTQNLN